MEFESQIEGNMISRRRPIHNQDQNISAANIRNTSATRLSQDTTEEFSDYLTDDFECEDGLYDDSVEYECATSSNLSKSRYTPDGNTLNRSKSVPKTPIRPARKLESNTYTSQAETVIPVEPMNNRMIIFLVTLLFLLMAAVSSMYYNESETHHPVSKCSYDDLKKLYPEQNEYLWKSLKIGTENILNKVTHSPGVYLLLHHGGNHVQNLIRKIGLRTSLCFGSSLKLIEMNPEDFKGENVKRDYGIIIKKYQSELKNGKVALIANLNEIPAQAARALHSICDTFSPIAEDVVVFLTLNIPKDMGSSNSVAYDYLFDLWSPNLERHELDPLITRVTDHILFLK